MVTVFCETCLLSFSVGVSASQESSMTSSLSASWWLWPYSAVMPPISATEVKPAVKKMKCGPDSIPAGVWKLPGCHNALILTSQFNWIISHDEVLRFGWPALQCPFGRAKVMSWSAQVISWFGESLQLDPERANLCSSGTQRSRRPCPVQLLYLTITSIVQYPGETSLPFIISVWVHQGSSLLPLFFILCMDKSMVNLLLWIVDYRETKPKDSDIITTDCNTLLDTQAWVINSLGPPVPGRCLFA